MYKFIQISVLICTLLCTNSYNLFALNAYTQCTSHDSVLLVHADGTDASTTFTDSSEQIATITTVGNAQVDTAQSKFDGASALFDGTGDYLTVPDSTNWNFGTGDFTIDSWVRLNSLATSNCFASQGGTISDRWIFTWNTTGAGQLVFVVSVGGVATISVQNAWTPIVGTWYHVVVVRSGNDFLMFVDGTQLGTTVTDTDTVPDFSHTLDIGARDNATVYGEFLDGWIDEMRIVKGKAVWTANFTPNTVAYFNCRRKLNVRAGEQ